MKIEYMDDIDKIDSESLSKVEIDKVTKMAKKAGTVILIKFRSLYFLVFIEPKRAILGRP